MNNRTITVKKEETVQFLSEIERYQTDLPDNCLFHKGKTGCGGTTIVLRNEKKVILVSPLVELIISKEVDFRRMKKEAEVNHELLAIYSQKRKAISWREIEKELDSTPLKIMVTIDSFPKLISTMNEKGMSPYTEYKIVIDEYHMLYNSYGYRYKAIRALLNMISQFTNVTCMTATPHQIQIFHELKHLDIEEVIWLNEPQVSVTSFLINKTAEGTAAFMKLLLEQKPSINLHIFLNSVTLISRVIAKAALQKEEVRIVCANNESQAFKRSNLEKLPLGFKIESTKDCVKKYNFYTSRSFEGCDIFDEDGVTILVTDAFVPSTWLDIETTIPQIIGRIRDSQYKNEIFHIFSTLPSTQRKKVVNEARSIISLKETCNEQATKCNDITSIETRKEHCKLLEDENHYIFWNERDSRAEVDDVMFHHEISTWMRGMHFYSSYLSFETKYQEKGYQYSPLNGRACHYTSDREFTANPQFKTCYLEYMELKEIENEKYFFGDMRMKDLNDWCSGLIELAIKDLGDEKVKALDYSKEEIKKEVKKGFIVKNKGEILNKIRTHPKIGSYTIQDPTYGKIIKGQKFIEVKQDIYFKMGYSMVRATASDISDFERVCPKRYSPTGKTENYYRLGFLFSE